MRTFIVAAALSLCACGARSTVAQEPAAKAATDSVKRVLVPTGLGTLKQDEFTMGIRSGALLVKVTPLDERIIRLAAPDTYLRLHNLADSRRGAAAERSNTQQPELFLVSFFSYQPDVTFQPEDVQIEYHGRQLRASAIIPLTPAWGRQRMDQQETQAAIYAFSDAFDYEQPIVIRYGMESNDDWIQLVPKLEVERAKILSRQPKN
ncbi:MAG TPA: hypothetical protein VF021_09490 [Longimicrobiales bacterium]